MTPYKFRKFLLNRFLFASSLALLGCQSETLDDASSDSSKDPPEGEGGAESAGSGGDVSQPSPSAGGATAASGGSGADDPSEEPEPDVHPSVIAKNKILDYFDSISGTHTLAGIENKSSTTPRGHTDEVAGLAGRTPAFWGVDFGFGSAAVDNRASVVAEAKRQWDAGAIVHFMFHTCIPKDDEYCSWDEIGGASPRHLTNEEWEQLLTPGTDLYKEWHRRLDLIAGHFHTLRDQGIAPMFRPLHEMNQCAFWWSCKTGQYGTVALWKETHDYLTNVKGLDNVIWVWNVQDFVSLSSDAVTYNPGTDYFDLATLDIYNTGYTQGNYEAIRSAAGGKPVGIGECQFLPEIGTLNSQPEWTFFMLWPDFIYEKRNTDIYTSLFATERVITLDEMPGWD